MKKSVVLCRLLATFLIVALVTAPFSAPMSGGMAAASTMMMSDETMMSGDMPCCPDKSAPVDCDKCLLMAACMVKTVQALPSAIAIEVMAVVARRLIPTSDPEADSLGQPPPPRPPRTLVLSA